MSETPKPQNVVATYLINGKRQYSYSYFAAIPGNFDRMYRDKKEWRDKSALHQVDWKTKFYEAKQSDNQ